MWQAEDDVAASEEPSELPQPESREEISEENRQEEEKAEEEEEGYPDLRWNCCCCWDAKRCVCECALSHVCRPCPWIRRTNADVLLPVFAYSKLILNKLCARLGWNRKWLYGTASYPVLQKTSTLYFLNKNQPIGRTLVSNSFRVLCTKNRQNRWIFFTYLLEYRWTFLEHGVALGQQCQSTGVDSKRSGVTGVFSSLGQKQ